MRPGSPRPQRHRQPSGGLGGIGKRELDLAHQAAVILRTKLRLGDMRGAGIGGRQVVERLSVVLAGLVEGGAAGEEDGRGDNVHRGDGGNGIGRDLFVAGHAHQAAMEEVTNLLGDLGGVELNALLAIELERKVDERRGIDRQTVAQDVDDTDSGTTQRVGIGGAGRGLADGKDTGDGVELVGEGHDAASGALRQLVAGKAGTIVIADGVGDLVVLRHRLA